MGVARRTYRIVVATVFAAATALFSIQFTGPAQPWARPITAVHAEECVLGQGYWKNHASAWPVQSLVLGDPATPAHTYTKSALLNILNTSTKGDASVVLAYQL